MRINVDNNYLAQRNFKREYGVKLSKIETEIQNGQDSAGTDMRKVLKPYVSFDKSSIPEDELIRIGKIDPSYM